MKSSCSTGEARITGILLIKETYQHWIRFAAECAKFYSSTMECVGSLLMSHISGVYRQHCLMRSRKVKQLCREHCLQLSSRFNYFWFCFIACWWYSLLYILDLPPGPDTHQALSPAARKTLYLGTVVAMTMDHSPK